VVAGASLDDTSNSALMAAWTSLYNSTQPDADATDDQRRPVGSKPAASAPYAVQSHRLQRNRLDPNLTHCQDGPRPAPEEMPAPTPQDVQHSVFAGRLPGVPVGDAGGIGGARAPAECDEQLSPKGARRRAV